MIQLQAVLEAAEEVQAFCLKQGWRLCFIGGVALQRWGEPRLTQDAGLTLLTGFGNEEFSATRRLPLGMAYALIMGTKVRQRRLSSG